MHASGGSSHGLSTGLLRKTNGDIELHATGWDYRKPIYRCHRARHLDHILQSRCESRRCPINHGIDIKPIDIAALVA